MDSRETLWACLPPRRPDEPAGLRQDIVDELSDHLACAYHRELLRGAESGAARARAWEQFGDPAAVARRLWLDAMKGKVMAQRLLVAALLVFMAACAGTVGLAWHWMNQDQLLKSRAAAEASETNRRLVEALAQSQATNQEMLKQMRDMSEAIRHPSSPDWNPVIFKLAEETPDGPPAVGFSLTLARLEGNRMGGAMGDGRGMGDGRMTLSMTNSLRRPLRVVLPPGLFAEAATGQYGGMGGMGGRMGGIGGGMGGMGGGMGGMGGMGGGMGGMGAAVTHFIYRTSDSSGVADFGAVQPGDYAFRITKHWARGSCGTSGHLNVMPGSKVEKLFVCPKTPPPHATVRVRCTWPADLEKEQLVVYAPFVFRHRKLQPDAEWTLSDALGPERPRRRMNQPGMMMSSMGDSPAIRSVLCGPATMLTEILNRKRLFLWSFAERGDAADRPKHPARVGSGPLRQGAGMGGSGWEVGAKLGPGDWADILTQDLHDVKSSVETPEPHELEWEPGTYGLNALTVLRPSRAQDVGTGRRRFDVLVATRSFGAPEWIQVRDSPPEQKDVESSSPNTTMGRMGGMMSIPLEQDPNAPGPERAKVSDQQAPPTLQLPAEYWDQVELGFEARLGQVNAWTIPLPEELTKAVRAALVTPPTPRVRTAAPPNLQ
jgi:hypothetical protein